MQFAYTQCLRLTIALGIAVAWTTPGVAQGSLSDSADFRRIITDAKEKVFPALIYVAPIAEEFSQGKREKQEQGGSGVIISSDGYAVTNWHVIENAISIRVLLSDGTFMTADKIGEDRETDIGLLKLHPKEGVTLPVAEFADSTTLVQGEFVLAMGAPWGLSRSVSLGILSSTERYLEGNSEYSLWLQTDASINPGNSGGPLVNTAGKVVGINTLGNNSGGDLGFAVPANKVKKIAAELREHGRMNRAWTGLHLQPLRDFSSNTVFEGERGVLVASVDANSPAEKAGLVVGDLILAVGGQETDGLLYEHLPAINTLLADLPKNEPVEVLVQRGPETFPRSMEPRAKGDVEGEDLELERWNMTVKAINEFQHPLPHFHAGAGVFVQGTRSPGNADEAGLERGDVIRDIDGTDVRTLADLKKIYERAVKRTGKEQKVLITVLRDGYRRQLVLDYSTKYID
ncbi:MAG: trypsin-like peptidase domain-containing protein [Planctomycetota bacterium]